MWSYFMVKGKKRFLSVINEDYWDYNVLFTFLFYALAFGWVIIFK